MKWLRFLLRSFLLSTLLLSSAPWLQAQTGSADETPASAPAPKVSFELNWKAANPEWYKVTVDRAGNAVYRSRAHSDPGEQPSDPMVVRFTMSQQNVQQIFSLAKELNYFQGNFSFRGKIANTGDKTLTYADGGKITKTTFNWSMNPKMMDMVELFQGMSTTFEMGNRLRYAMRYDKLGVDSLLKSMEEMNKDHELVELQVLKPEFTEILNDPVTMNISKQRIRRMLDSLPK